MERAGGPDRGRAPARHGGGAMTATRKPKRSSKAKASSSSSSRRRPPEVLSEAEVIRLLKACSTRAPTGVRNRALIAVLWRCGLRISEALSLELRDVNLEAGTVRVRHGKGDRSRTVGIDEQTTALMARWIDRRKKLSPGARAPIFCTLQGGRLDSSYVRRMLPRLAAKAGIDRRVHAHGLRHTYASELAREGTAINVIRDALGHTSLAVTDRYLRDVAPTHVIDTMRARRWESA
ncbi:MAG: tyrosine-type recombinase/integrase [Pseudonocardiaceae bacterium]